MPSHFPTSSVAFSTTGLFSGKKIWCPLCKDHHPFLPIANAARLLEVDRRTIYRHIEDGSVHDFRVGGNGRYRVCSGCLLAQHSASRDLRYLTKSVTQKSVT